MGSAEGKCKVSAEVSAMLLQGGRVTDNCSRQEVTVATPRELQRALRGLDGKVQTSFSSRLFSLPHSCYVYAHSEPPPHAACKTATAAAVENSNEEARKASL